MNYEMIKEAYELGVADALSQLKTANALTGTAKGIYNAFGKSKYIWAPRLTEAGIGAGVGAVGGAGLGLAGSDPGHRVGDTVQGAALGALAGGLGAPLFGHFKMNSNIRNALSQGQNQLRMLNNYDSYLHGGKNALTGKGVKMLNQNVGGAGLNKKIQGIRKGMNRVPDHFRNQAFGGGFNAAPFQNMTGMKDKLFNKNITNDKYIKPRASSSFTGY